MTSAIASATYPAGGHPGALEVTEDRLAELAREHLDGAPGFFRLTGLPYRSVEDASKFALQASAMLGELLPQDGQGSLLRQVTDRGVRLGEGLTGRYSDSRQGGSLHTDAPHHPAPVPDCFALYCVHQARWGGELCLVHADTVLAQLPSWAIEQLRGEFHFDRRDDTAREPTVRRAILELGPAGLRMHYLREYIEIGHRHRHVPALTEDQMAAMDALDAVLDNPAYQHCQLRLEPGDMVFINNRSTLHGRTEFSDDAENGEKRLMLRTWILRRPG